MTMIEKVARAIAWGELPADARQFATPETMYVEPHYLDLARAALEAMREPSPSMCEAAFESTGPGSMWRAMLDAALAEPSPGK